VSDSTISIKVADGSYRRVIERGFSGRKKLTVTTVRDNQDKVQIDLYRGNGGGRDEEPRYIGSLVVENIPPAPQGEPEIELSIGITRQGELSAEASDRTTGESQKFSTTLTTLPEGEVAEVPEFEMESGAASEPDFEERPLTGESYRVRGEDRRKDVVKGKGPNLLLLFLFVLLGVLLVAAIAYFIYRSVRGPEIPPLIGGTSTETTPQQPQGTQPSAGSGQPAQPSGSQTTGSQAQTGTTASAAGTTQPAAGQGQTQAGGGQTSVKSAGGEAKVVAKGGVTYRIKRGDTLWDISATYYRNPWLYHKLARANSIRNPDLIFAGTRIYIPEN
jgi:LysM repeat protein